VLLAFDCFFIKGSSFLGSLPAAFFSSPGLALEPSLAGSLGLEASRAAFGGSLLSFEASFFLDSSIFRSSFLGAVLLSDPILLESSNFFFSDSNFASFFFSSGI